MLRFLLILVSALAISGPVRAQSFIPVPSTPDLAVTATATADFAWTGVSGGKVDWIYLKNDCAKPIWFGFRGERDGLARQYPLKLLQNQTFSGPLAVYSVGASPDNTGTACTFSMMGATGG